MTTEFLSVYLLGSFLAFFSIACKSINQKSVQYNRYWLIPPVSYLQAMTELFTAGIFVHTFIQESITQCIILGLFIGTGSWTGCIFGIKVQGKLVKLFYKQEVKV